jgi:hypothetical protein
MATSSIQKISYSAPRQDFISALERDGCVIVKNFTDIETLEKAQSEVQPYLDANDKGSKVGGKFQGQPSTKINS